MRVSLARAGIRQGTFSNHHIKGIAKYQISSYEGTAFKVTILFFFQKTQIQMFRSKWTVHTWPVQCAVSPSHGINGFQVNLENQLDHQ